MSIYLVEQRRLHKRSDIIQNILRKDFNKQGLELEQRGQYSRKEEGMKVQRWLSQFSRKLGHPNMHALGCERTPWGVNARMRM